MSSRELVVIANAAAGSMTRERIDRFLSTLPDARPHRVCETDSPDDVADVVEANAGARLVVAGGDGSLNVVVSELVRLDRLDDVEVAVLPLGTGNDTAGGLGIDDDNADAVAAGDNVHPIDVIETDHGTAVNVIHLGIGAEAADRAASLKRYLGPAAYSVGAIWAGIRTGPWRVTVAVDGEVLHGLSGTTMIAVGNGFRIGGGLPLLPEARHDSGLLEVMVVGERSKRERVRFAANAVRGRHPEMETVRRARGTTVQITGAPMLANRDGELFGPITEMTATVRPGALRMCVPEGYAPS